MKTLLLILLLLAAPALADVWDDANQMYVWDGTTLLYPTVGAMKSAVLDELGTDCVVQGTIGCAVLWVDDGDGNASIQISTVDVVGTDPTPANATEGRLILSTASGNLFFKSANGFFEISGTYTPD